METQPTLSDLIEDYLLKAGGWVSAGELVERFGVGQRELRANNGVPGLCTRFAISGNMGYRHVAAASEEEMEHFYTRGRAHGIGELVRLRALKRRRAALLVPRTEPPAETLDGQFLLLPGVGEGRAL